MDGHEMTGYQKWEHDMISDIGHDTDALIKMQGGKEMSESYNSGMLTGILSRQGMDMADVMALINSNRNNGTWGDDGLMFLFLVLLLGGGNGLWGNRGAEGVAGVDRTVVNTSNYEMLMSAIRGNEQSMQTLATSLNCSIGQVQSALCGIDKQIALSQGSIEQALCQCCNGLSTKILESRYETSRQMADGFCSTNLNVERSQNALSRQFSDCCCEQKAATAQLQYNMASQFAAQTQFIQNQFCEQNAYLADQFCQIKSREDAREIQCLRDQLSDAKADARALATVSAVNAGRSFTGTVTGDTFSGNIPANVFP